MVGPGYEVVGRDANGDDWTIATAGLAETRHFMNVFAREGLTDIQVTRVGGRWPGERAGAPTGEPDNGPQGDPGPTAIES